jgi:galactonate dehydratase
MVPAAGVPRGREVDVQSATALHYAIIAPHNPLGPISLAAGLHLAASIPTFLCQEQVTWAPGT